MAATKNPSYSRVISDGMPQALNITLDAQDVLRKRGASEEGHIMRLIAAHNGLIMAQHASRCAAFGMDLDAQIRRMHTEIAYVLSENGLEASTLEYMQGAIYLIDIKRG